MTIQKILLSFEPKKENVLPALKKINRLFGFIDKSQAYLIAEYFGIAPSRLYGLITAGELFKTSKPARVCVSVCNGPHCQMKNAGGVVREIEKYLGVKADHKGTRKASVETISCVGQCTDGPVVIVNETMYEKVKNFEVDDILRNYI